MNRTSTNDKQIAFRCPYWSPTPPYWRFGLHGSPDRNIFFVSDVYTRDMVRMSQDGGGVFRTNQGEGGVQKVSFY